MTRPYPDYGEPGAPGMDPYYVSPDEERRRETARAESIEGTIDAYRSDLIGLLEDLRDSLERDNAELASVTITIVPPLINVEIKVKS